MAYGDRDRGQERLVSAGLALALSGGLAAALLTLGRGHEPPSRQTEATVRTFSIVPPPPPPLPVPSRAAPRKAGASAPPAKKASATPVSAPKPVVTLPRDTRVAAEKPAQGRQEHAGAAPVAGPGTGAGGPGTGLGRGRGGDGDGGGGSGAGLRLISGKITRRDFPRSARGVADRTSVTVWYMVGVDGRAHGCRVVASSGNADLDASTCRLIEARFRYEPARDRTGRPVPRQTGWRQDWWLD